MSYTPDQMIMLMLSDLDEATAISLAESGWWNLLDDNQVAFLQFHQERLCMPFPEFHKRFEALIGRPVFSHESMSSNMRNLQEEIETGIHPSLNEILALLPSDKLVTWHH